jgi:hypothetical protein
LTKINYLERGSIFCKHTLGAVALDTSWESVNGDHDDLSVELDEGVDI